MSIFLLLRQSEALELGYFSAILNLILVGLMRGVVYVVEHYFFAQQLVQLLESFLQSLRLLVVEAEVPVEAEAVVL